MADQFQIFISYRRMGGAGLAQFLENKLSARGFRVFIDVEKLQSGNFSDALLHAIDECTDVLVVLSPNALDRCEDPDDWVRKEIAHATRSRKNVIPIIMNGFEWPRTLPEDIAGIRMENGASYVVEYSNALVDSLTTKLLHSKSRKIQTTDERLLDDAEKGDTKAMNELAMRYEEGSETLARDRQKAFACYERAAALGDPGALYNLADIYEQCERDWTLVFEYGVQDMISCVSEEEARNVMRRKAEELYRQAEAKGFTPATYRLANLAEERHDFQRALRLYQTAADRGYPQAMNALGHYLMNGILSECEPQRAEKLYRRAAEAGYAPAIYNYARTIELRDPQEAIRQYRKVAYGENAIPQAAFALGRLYERALHDMQNAAIWYRIALDAGFQEAENDLKRCRNLTRDPHPVQERGERM
ncbi:MAG: toll/interleukin-1 receptor domain-containing protein [Clostridia bacterium]|nr:toll/interleukin-1 receptor domain-containing protein [Clostridia bacterium]